VFTRRLREMEGQAKTRLAEALKSASGPALVRSAFELPGEQRSVIQNALNETFSADIKVQFETAPDLISGIELTTNGQKVAWSIADYLASMEKDVDDLLKEKDKAEVKSTSSSDLTPQIAKRAYDYTSSEATRVIRHVRTGVRRNGRSGKLKPKRSPSLKSKRSPSLKSRQSPSPKPRRSPSLIKRDDGYGI